MPILAEAISVIVKDSALKRKFEGGVQRFIDFVPNSTYCSDGELHRVGFMAPQEVELFCDDLSCSGLSFYENKEFIDFAVVDMLKGPTLKCPWLGFSRGSFFKDLSQFKMCNEDFSIVWLLHKKRGYSIPVNSNLEYFVSLPMGWSPDKALYTKNFMPTEEFNTKMFEINTENNLTKYWNQETGEISHIGRPKIISQHN